MGLNRRQALRRMCAGFGTVGLLGMIGPGTLRAEGARPDLWFDVWYEPSHIVRIARWQRDHSLSTRPVVVVDSIAGLDERLSSPELLRVAGSVELRIERVAVDTVLALPGTGEPGAANSHAPPNGHR